MYDLVIINRNSKTTLEGTCVYNNKILKSSTHFFDSPDHSPAEILNRFVDVSHESNSMSRAPRCILRIEIRNIESLEETVNIVWKISLETQLYKTWNETTRGNPGYREMSKTIIPKIGFKQISL